MSPHLHLLRLPKQSRLKKHVWTGLAFKALPQQLGHHAGFALLIL